MEGLAIAPGGWRVSGEAGGVSPALPNPSLIQSARDLETKINSEMMLKLEGANRYLDEKRQLKKVFENVPVQDLSLDKYDNNIVFYTELNDMQEVLEGLILHHNYVPTKIKHKRFHIVRIVFEKDEACTTCPSPGVAAWASSDSMVGSRSPSNDNSP